MNPKSIQLTSEIIEAINEELAYQTSLSGTSRADTVNYSLEGQIITLSTYTRKVEDAWTNGRGRTPALLEMLKVAAIAVRALLASGEPIPRRKT